MMRDGAEMQLHNPECSGSLLALALTPELAAVADAPEIMATADTFAANSNWPSCLSDSASTSKSYNCWMAHQKVINNLVIT